MKIYRDNKLENLKEHGLESLTERFSEREPPFIT